MDEFDYDLGEMDLTPFKLDIDELLDDYTQGQSTTLADLKRVWVAKRFSFNYEARLTSNSAYFMQSLFAHSISHMVSAAALSCRLGGLYCLYCLYETQPYKPCFKIYLSLRELKRLKSLVVDAKENGIGSVPALVKRMLEKNMFLFGFVDMVGGCVTQRVDDITKLQNRRVQIAYEKLLANTKIEDSLHMDLMLSDYHIGSLKDDKGVELDLKALKNMSAEYAKTKELAVREASHIVDVKDIKHYAKIKKLVGDMVEAIVEEWDSQKEAFYKQTGISRHNVVAIDDFDELERLLNE